MDYTDRVTQNMALAVCEQEIDKQKRLVIQAELHLGIAKRKNDRGQASEGEVAALTKAVEFQQAYLEDLEASKAEIKSAMDAAEKDIAKRVQAAIDGKHHLNRSEQRAADKLKEPTATPGAAPRGRGRRGQLAIVPASELTE